MPASWESCSSPMLHAALHHRDDVMMPFGNVPLFPFPPHPALGDNSTILCSCSGGTEAEEDMAVGTGL